MRTAAVWRGVERHAARDIVERSRHSDVCDRCAPWSRRCSRGTSPGAMQHNATIQRKGKRRVRERLMGNAALWGTLGRSSPYAHQHDESEAQAPAWRADASHICSGSTAAAARESEPTAVRSSLLPALPACPLTCRVRSLLRYVEPLQGVGVTNGRRQGSEQRPTAGRPPSSKQHRITTATMKHSSVLSRMVLCLCVSDLWLERTRVTRCA